MTSNNLYADVILPLAVKGSFTYRLPPETGTEISPGMLVSVPFGKKKIYTAVIYKVYQNKPSGYEIKNIVSVLDAKPVVNDLQIKLWEWISEYYMCTLGEICNAALPSGLKLESETRIIPQRLPDQEEPLEEPEKYVLDFLRRTDGMNIKQLQKVYQDRNVMPLLKIMMDKGLLSIEEKFRKKIPAKKLIMVRLSEIWNNAERIDELFHKLTRSGAKKRLLSVYLELAGESNGKTGEGIQKNVLLRKAETGNAVFNEMMEQEIFAISEKETPLSEITLSKIPDHESKQPVNLNDAQQLAFQAIVKNFLNHDVVLLHGVTSSGKTEIYIHLIRETINKGKQVLYLLPEIALTAQMINRLRLVFGKKVAVYHSKYSDRERLETWKDLLQDCDQKDRRVNIILGARSSIFLPFMNLGLIIVDEEHENSYKQFDPAPRYHARDTAIILAGLHGAKVVLGTATPSLESYHNSTTGKYGLVELPDRYLDMKMPEILVVNTREARRRKAMYSHFSAVLADHITRALQNHNQVILFQNRRGFSSYLQCQDCGYIPLCRRCDVSLTYHKNNNRLKCHYCGYSEAVPMKCPVCKSEHILMKGFGTEKVEEEIALLFPGANAGRLDLDTTRTRKSYEHILDAFDRKELDILVGTQMVSKGLDFDNVKVVGIMNADTMLNYPDFRAYERSFQLMAQVSGRAGRKKERGLVIIQTTYDTHPVIDAVVKNDYHALYANQADERRKFNYPPFSRLISVTLKHRDRELLDEAAEKLARNLKRHLGDRVVGPEYPLVPRKHNYHMKNMLIKIEKGNMLQEAKAFVSEEIRALLRSGPFKSIQVIPDVDPY
ncbi:MAG: primosomal protein N' [Bacteroidales bacterium]|nr:primosomal protein N' [Bacteroidales bacterium]